MCVCIEINAQKIGSNNIAAHGEGETRSIILIKYDQQYQIPVCNNDMWFHLIYLRQNQTVFYNNIICLITEFIIQYNRWIMVVHIVLTCVLKT